MKHNFWTIFCLSLFFIISAWTNVKYASFRYKIQWILITPRGYTKPLTSPDYSNIKWVFRLLFLLLFTLHFFFVPFHLLYIFFISFQFIYIIQNVTILATPDLRLTGDESTEEHLKNYFQMEFIKLCWCYFSTTSFCSVFLFIFTVFARNSFFYRKIFFFLFSFLILIFTQTFNQNRTKSNQQHIENILFLFFC